MTRAEAKSEAMRLFDERNKKADEVYKKLRRSGRDTTLDGAIPQEVKNIDDECRRKIKELAAQIEE